MKKYIFNLATALLFGASLLASSCGKDGETTPTYPEPNFPEKTTPTVEAGQTYTLEIEPNADWEISIPTSGDAAKWFWIQDGSQKVFSLRGSQGKRSIVIATLNQPDYDNSHTCDVTMKMKGSDGQEKSRVVATISIGKLIPMISVYTAQIEDEDVFIFNPEYDFNTETDVQVLKYLYNETATTEIPLIWPYASNNYSIPILVESNFDWGIIGDLPTWLSDPSITSGKAGQKKEIRLLANLKNIPENGAKATITFGDQNNSFPVEVSVPAHTQLFKTEYAIECLFNASAEYYDLINENFVKGNAYGQISSDANLKFLIFAVVDNGSGGTKLDYQPSAINWITPIDVWDNTNTSKAQNRRVEFKTEANRGKAREAIALGVPKIIAEATTQDKMIQGNQIAEEYQKYIITTIKQQEHYGIISPKDLPSALLQSGSQFIRRNADDPIFADFNVTGDAYNLTYTTTWAERASTMIFEKKYTTYECFDSNKVKITTAPGEHWLGAEINLDGTTNAWLGTIKMNKAKIGAGTDANKGYIVFSDDSGNFAVVYCVYDELFEIPLDPPAFYNPTAAAEDGSTLVKLTSGPLYDQYKDKGVPIWHLTYTKKIASMSMVKNLPKFPAMQAPWLTYNFSGAYSVISMTLDKNEDSSAGKTSAIFLYTDQLNTRIKMVLVCTLKIK